MSNFSGLAFRLTCNKRKKLPHWRHDSRERSEWTVTEASKRQFWAALWPPGMRVLFAVCKLPTVVFFFAADLLSSWHAFSFAHDMRDWNLLRPNNSKLFGPFNPSPQISKF
jgi:hypothetical protein